MTLAAELEEALGEPAELEGAVSGGCIHDARTARTASGRRVFLKWDAEGGPLFAAEADGLRALRDARAVRVPEVLAVTPRLLVLEHIEQGRAGLGFTARFAAALVGLHRVTCDRWGYHSDGFCGRTPQPNGWMDDGVAFFRERRLGHQHALLRRSGRSTPALDRALTRVCERLGEWLPLDERPALLHGDLWSGNYLVSVEGEPVLIDPAVYYGFREADLAMTELFGGFPRGLIEAYDEAWPLSPGYEDRRDLYNLYHVLNHANLFGGGYVAQAERIARLYGG